MPVRRAVFMARSSWLVAQVVLTVKVGGADRLKLMLAGA